MNPHGDGKTLARMLGGLLLVGSTLAHAVEVRMMAQETVAPKWIANAGRLDGMCPDIIAAMQRAEPRLHFVTRLPTRSLPAIENALATGEVDAACALSDWPKRRKIAEPVGAPLYALRHRLAGRADDDVAVNSMGDLVRLKALVNVNSGSGFAGRLKAAGVAVDDSSSDNLVNLRKVLAGHGRFTFMNELALNRYIRTRGWQHRIRVLPLVDEEPAYFWVSRKAAPDVAPLAGKALARIKASGELDRIYANWARRK